VLSPNGPEDSSLWGPSPSPSPLGTSPKNKRTQVRHEHTTGLEYLVTIVTCIGACFSVASTRELLKKLSVLPTHVLKEYPCLSYWSVSSSTTI